MPLEKTKRAALVPKIRRGRGGKKPKRKSARQNLREPMILPSCSRKPLPKDQPCDMKSCKEEFCSAHCKNPETVRGERKYQHVVDAQWMGWAKGYRDGTFDVSCVNCGELGWVRYLPDAGDVDWG